MEAANEFDSPWKEALDLYLQAFLNLCIPEIHDRIDWSKGFEALDSELRRITRGAKTGTLAVDRLYRVYLKGGRKRLLHIHIEVQCQRDARLPKRVYVYNYRIRDLKAGMPMSLVVFGDDSPTWRPDRYTEKCLGCISSLKYNTVKLLDYRKRIEELAASDNPIAPFIVAHLQVLATTEGDRQRGLWKFRLIRSLYEKGLEKDEILRRFRLIDWIMNLKPDLELEFERDLKKYEEGLTVPYVTAIERNGIKKGREEGLKEGRQEGRLIGRIQTLQEYLGIPVDSNDVLETLSLDILREREAALVASRPKIATVAPKSRPRKKS